MATPDENFSLPVPAEALIPHRPPMLLIDMLTVFEGSSGITEVKIKEGSLLVDSEGRLDQVATMEMIAQSFAALKGYDDLLNGRSVKRGYLVSAREIKFLGHSAINDTLQIRVRTVTSLGGFSAAEGEVLNGDELLATGAIKVWTPDEG